jgi:hypothetical protein
MKTYKRTKQLNRSDRASTGAVTAFYGNSPWERLKTAYMFLEVSDCSHKVRLHNSSQDTKKDFIIKMKSLRKEIDKFIAFLES